MIRVAFDPGMVACCLRNKDSYRDVVLLEKLSFTPWGTHDIFALPLSCGKYTHRRPRPDASCSCASPLRVQYMNPLDVWGRKALLCARRSDRWNQVVGKVLIADFFGEAKHAVRQ
ncbi:hypothetical protein VTN00DRAFT_7930 [Thermoascus crustaceus]|uniref:uncharacterized protein n=1 Tax=Thermoascus crustaceus TaxID=5088 RepID=UPI0037432FE6